MIVVLLVFRVSGFGFSGFPGFRVPGFGFSGFSGFWIWFFRFLGFSGFPGFSGFWIWFAGFQVFGFLDLGFLVIRVSLVFLSVFKVFRVGGGRGRSLHAQGTFLNLGGQSKKNRFL